MFIMYNPNPHGLHVGDCTVRALSKALNKDWHSIYLDLVLEGYMLSDMPSANRVWGSYLKKKGFKREVVPDNCSTCYTLKNFCENYRQGTYIVAMTSHVACVCDGDYYDTWDSGEEIPIYYWKMEEE